MKKYILILLIACLLTGCAEEPEIETTSSEPMPTRLEWTPQIEEWEYEFIAEGEIDREWLLNKIIFHDERNEDLDSEKLTYWEVLYEDERLKKFFEGQEFDFGEIEIDYGEYAVLVTCGRELSELQGWLDRRAGDHIVIVTLEEEHKGDKVFLYQIPRKGVVGGCDSGFLLIDGQKTYMQWYLDVINYDRGQWTPPESIPEPFIFELED